MPKIKVLSGDDVINILEYFGFFVIHQRGSHVKLQRNLHNVGIKQTLTIPRHKELDRGTLKAIYQQALRYIPENQLFGYFFHKT